MKTTAARSVTSVVLMALASAPACSLLAPSDRELMGGAVAAQDAGFDLDAGKGSDADGGGRDARADVAPCGELDASCSAATECCSLSCLRSCVACIPQGDPCAEGKCCGGNSCQSGTCQPCAASGQACGALPCCASNCHGNGRCG